jgi:hypothetical protein
MLILSFLGLNGFILFGISSIWSYFNTGADRASMLHLQEEMDQSYRPKLVWDNLENEGRVMEKQTLLNIEKDYLNAWYVRNIAFENNDPKGIADYYTDSARIKLHRIMDLNRKSGTSLKTTTIKHNPKLEFYSADGKLVMFTDKNVTIYEEVYSKKKLLTKGKNISTYQVILLLEDGFWRIRHMVEIPSANPLAKQSAKPFIKSISKIKGVNYYPKHTPWKMFGTQFNSNIIASDFKSIQKMGLNTIRIFVPYQAFGKANIDLLKLTQLETTLDIAEIHNLKVILTLFDFYSDYEIQNWTLTHRHAEQLVLRLKNHPALLVWDIKNEPDLDFESRGKDKVLAWLEQMISNISEWDNLHPVTIGWSRPEAAVHLSNKVDFVSFHYYKEVSDFAKAYQTLKSKVANKTVVLQEFGHSSYNGIWNAYLGSEDDQAAYHRQLHNILKNEEIPFLFWTLYDFDDIPNPVVGRIPWRKAKQKYFGILDGDGNQKKVYSVINRSN